MFDIGMAEMLVVGIVALIVVGPKDLPVLFKKAGQFVGRMKSMAREFSSAMDDAAKQSGMDDVKDTLRTMTDPMKAGLDGVKSAATNFADFDPESETGKLSKERQEQAKKIKDAAAKTAQERIDREKAAAKAADAPAATPKGDVDVKTDTPPAAQTKGNAE